MECQTKTLKFILKRKWSGVFNQPGTGKTLTILEYIRRKPPVRRALVVCLKENINTWRDEIVEWYGDTVYRKMIGGTQARRIKTLAEAIKCDEDKVIVIVNWDAIKNKKIYDMIRSTQWDFIAWDESSESKNEKSDRHDRWYKASKRIPRRIIMDGEPQTVDEQDLYGQYRLLDRGKYFGLSVWRFRKKHCRCLNRDYQQFELTPSGMKRIHRVLAKTSVRFLKKDMKDIPPKRHSIIYCGMSKEQKKAYNNMLKEFETDGVEVDYTIAQMRKLHQITSGFIYKTDWNEEKDIETREAIEYPSEKMRILKKLLPKMIKAYPKIVIWCAYTWEIESILDLCRTLGIKAVGYYGGLSYIEKQKSKFFFGKGNAEIIVGQISGGIGLNELQVSELTIYYSKDFKLRSKLQSEDRQNRKGKKKKKKDYFLSMVVDKTVDGRIHKTLKKRQDFAKQVVDKAFVRQIIREKYCGE